MVQLPTQPDVFRRPDLPAFDGLPMIDRAFCSALRVARTLGDNYATEGMDLEEVGLAHTMENLLYTIPQKCEAALGEHPTDVASFERWSNLDMVDHLWWMLQAEKTKVRSLGCISVCDILKSRSRPMILGRWFVRRPPPWMYSIMRCRILKTSWPASRRLWRECVASMMTISSGTELPLVISTRSGCPTRQPLKGSTNAVPVEPMAPATTTSRLWKRSHLRLQLGLPCFRNRCHSK